MDAGSEVRREGDKLPADRLSQKEAFPILAVSGNIIQKKQCKPSPQVCRQGSTSEPVRAHGSTTHQGNIINTSQLSFIDNTGRSDKIGYAAKSCICFIQALLEKAISCHEDNRWCYLWQQNQREGRKKPQDGVNKREIFTCPAQASVFALTKCAFPKEFTAPAVQGWQLAAKLISSPCLHRRLPFLISNLSE